MTKLLALLVPALLCAQVPTITKVEPPNWWAGHSIATVRLLVRGTGLGGATVTGDLKTGGVRVNGRGTYLFVDVTIPRHTRPGPVRLTLKTARGTAAIPFEVSDPLPPQGRFQGFSPDDLIYLIMPDRFSDGDPSNNDPKISRGLFDKTKPRYYHGGDLQGIINRLPYLKNLGVTAIWLNPVYDNVNHLNTKEVYAGNPITDYHGYGAVDFYGVEEHFGTLAKFRELVDAAHRAGIKVIQDQVANHTGPFHPWVDDSPLPDWYHGTAREHINETWQTWTLADPHSNAAMRKPTLDGWFLNILPDLNQEEPEMARYLIQNTLWWIGMSGIDGIRQDTLPYVPRTFWRDWTAAIHREYPKMNVVGEMFDGDPALVSFFQGGRTQFDGVDSGVDTLFDFPLFYIIRNVFARGRPASGLASMLAHDRLYPDASRLVTFLGLHDVERFMNVPGATPEKLKLAFTFLLTTRGTPMIYYGDEIAMPGGNDPDNRRDFPPEKFDAPGEVHEHLAKLARMRAENECLRRGELATVAATETIYAYRRSSGNCEATVVLNTGSSEATVDGIRAGPLSGEIRITRR
jgi:glycosidase